MFARQRGRTHRSAVNLQLMYPGKSWCWLRRGTGEHPWLMQGIERLAEFGQIVLIFEDLNDLGLDEESGSISNRCSGTASPFQPWWDLSYHYRPFRTETGRVASHRPLYRVGWARSQGEKKYRKGPASLRHRPLSWRRRKGDLCRAHTIIN